MNVSVFNITSAFASQRLCMCRRRFLSCRFNRICRLQTSTSIRHYSPENLQKTRLFPKVQLHIHLDGAVRHSTLWNLARKRGIVPKGTTFQDYLEGFRIANRGDLARFLSNFDKILPVIRGDKETINRVAYELCEDQAREGVIYFEARYCPHFLASHPKMFQRDENVRENVQVVSPRDVVIAVNDGIRRGCQDFGVKGRTILCMMRTIPEISQDIIELCEEFQDDTVVAVDLAGEEATRTTKEHEDAFRLAEDLGIHRTVHAGEVGPAENVRFAIEQLGAERIGHGYQIASDPTVYQMVRDQFVHLELCPTSSLYTGAWTGRLADHCVRRFIEDGLNVSLNTDDPTILLNTMETEFQLAREHFSMDDTQLVELTLNAARASFLPQQEQEQLVKELQTRLGLYS